MEQIELTPKQIDGINKLALFIRDYEQMKKSPNTRRRPRCPSCDDGLHRNWKQIEQEEQDSQSRTQHNNMQDELPEK